MIDKENDVVQGQQVVRRLYMASVLCLIFMCVELAGGYFANSLAIMSDAAHLFSDLAAFLVSIGAAHLSSLPSTNKHTYGLKRVESLAALFSMGSLALVCIYLAIQAIIRIKQFMNGTMDEVDGKFMSLIATIGVVVNLALAWVLGGAHPELPGAHGHDHDHGHGDEEGGHGHGDQTHDDHENHDRGSHDHGSDDHGSHDHASHDDESTPLTGASVHVNDAVSVATRKEPRNVNLNAAYLHVLGDLLQSFAVLVAGLIIWLVPGPNIRILDPIATLVFCVLVFYATIGVMRACIAVILEEVPPDVSWEAVHQDISNVEGVSNVHDLHIWSISQGVPALSVHCNAIDPDKALTDILLIISKKHKIVHSTAQIKRGTGAGCPTEHGKNCYMAA